MPKTVFRKRKGAVCAGGRRHEFTHALHALMGSGLDPRRERLIISRGRSHSRPTIEAPARVFHQGPGDMPNMTGCSFAVRHLLHRSAPWYETWAGKCDERKTVRVVALFGEALVVEVTGAARLHRAASSDRRERGRPPGWAGAYAGARENESAQESALATRRLNEVRRQRHHETNAFGHQGRRGQTCGLGTERL